MKNNNKFWFCTIVLSLFFVATNAQQNVPISLRSLADSAIANSKRIKISQQQISKTELDKRKAYESYLPKITGEVSYTHLNADIRLPSEMETLLTATQTLLIKEATSMKMAGMAIPDAYKVNFQTNYTDATNPVSQTLQKTVSENLKPINPIQDKDIVKMNISAQMLLFGGLKVSNTAKAVEHQISAMQFLTEKEKVSIISELITTYDKLALIYKSEEVIAQSEAVLEEQAKFVAKAAQNGLVIELDKQKIEMARIQLNTKRIEIASNKQLLLAKLHQITGIQTTELVNINPQLNFWIVDYSSYNLESRYDIMAIDESVKALKFKEISDKSEYIPKLVAFGKKEFRKADLSTFDPEWYVGVALRWNIFDGMSASRAAQQSKIEQNIMKQKKDDALEMLELNMVRLKLEAQKNEQLYLLAEQQVKIAREAFNLTKKQLSNGLCTITDYLNSLTSLENAEFEVIKVKYAQRALAVEFLENSNNLTIDKIVE